MQNDKPVALATAVATPAVGTLVGVAAQPTVADLMARIAELEASQRASASSNIRFKVSEKGALSVYGIQRFPVSLYVDQWERLIARQADMVAFMKANVAGLKRKVTV